MTCIQHMYPPPQGMRFLHAADPPIVHGDLKSANVLVDENFRAKITDFGLFKRKVLFVGTPFFVDPEYIMYKYMCMYVCIYMCMYVCMDIHVNVCVCMYVCMYHIYV